MTVEKWLLLVLRSYITPCSLVSDKTRCTVEWNNNPSYSCLFIGGTFRHGQSWSLRQAHAAKSLGYRPGEWRMLRAQNKLPLLRVYYTLPNWYVHTDCIVLYIWASKEKYIASRPRRLESNRRFIWWWPRLTCNVIKRAAIGMGNSISNKHNKYFQHKNSQFTRYCDERTRQSRCLYAEPWLQTSIGTGKAAKHLSPFPEGFWALPS